MHPLHQHINEIVHLTDEEFAYVLQHFTPLRKRKYQYLVQEGELAHREYWVVKGCLKSSYLDLKGKEHVLSFAMENWWVTDYKAFIHQAEAEVNVDCLEDCELLAISFENRDKLTRKMHKMERFWAKKTKLGYAALQGRILSLLRDSAAERYQDLLQTYPQLAQRVSKKLIASYLGVSRETLSRMGA